LKIAGAPPARRYFLATPRAKTPARLPALHASAILISLLAAQRAMNGFSAIGAKNAEPFPLTFFSLAFGLAHRFVKTVQVPIMENLPDSPVASELWK